tara:strand:- start:13 stop:567 length:555 start_codon:yes stop_codon:yes gene_type:complete
MKKLFLTSITALLFVFNTNAQNPTSQGVLNKVKMTNNVFAEFSMLEVEFYKNGTEELKNKNISTYIVGFTSTLPLSKNFDLRGSVGMTEGFSYNFVIADIALKLSENFSLHYGVGSYFINDDRWVTLGIDGNEPSDIDFGMNFGINLQLTKSLGITMKYNLIEEKEEDISSMSLGGLSFGVTIR